MLDYADGLLKIANVFLSLVAAIIAISLFKESNKRQNLKPWKLLIIALLFFTIQEILGALRAFGIFSTPYLTHIVPTIMLCLLVVALIYQIEVHKR